MERTMCKALPSSCCLALPSGSSHHPYHVTIVMTPFMNVTVIIILIARTCPLPFIDVTIIIILATIVYIPFISVTIIILVILFLTSFISVTIIIIDITVVLTLLLALI